MVEQAKAANIGVVLLTIPPQVTSASYLAKIRSLNSAITAMGQSEGVTVIDIYSPLVRSDGSANATYFISDDLHFSSAGVDKVWQTINQALVDDSF
jgi:lysophospholipase L1-like esterase